MPTKKRGPKKGSKRTCRKKCARKWVVRRSSALVGGKKRSIKEGICGGLFYSIPGHKKGGGIHKVYLTKKDKSRLGIKPLKAKTYKKYAQCK